MLDIKKLLTKILNWFASGSNQQILSESSPPSSALYGSRMRLRGNGLSGTAGTFDTYWLGIDSYGTFYTGTQLNQASTITWRNVPAGVADYVVEQGLTNNWYYRKWNSGFVEAWTRTSDKSYAITTQSGSGYWTSESIALPSGMFTAIYGVQANRLGGQGLVFVSAYTASTSAIGVYIACTLSITQSMAITLYVAGKWK